MTENLDKIFNPKSIAIIGASNRPGSVGYAIMKNVIDAGYEGKVYPVNLKYGNVQSIKSYRNIKKIPEPVDLAVIVTPAKTVLPIVIDCGKSGVGGLLIISAGFKEIGAEGEKLADEILDVAQKYKMRLVGPNCLGFINPGLKLNASFGNRMALPGNIAFISQSGALCTAILDWAVEQKVGFSHFVSIGSMIDVGFDDLIDYFGDDPNTSSILIYMESLTKARRFLSAAKAISRKKPIIVLKAGKSVEGAGVALSHTGSMAGNDDAFNAAFKRTGIIRVETIEQLFDCAEALSKQPLPKGNRLAIVTNSGGPGVLATDYLVEHGGKLAEFSTTTFSKLNEILPQHWSKADPVDVLGDTPAERYAEAARLLLSDDNVDGLLAIMNPQAIVNTAAVAREIIPLTKQFDKPIFAVWMGERDVVKAREILENGGIPHYYYPESAVDVFMKMYKYSRNLELLYETPLDIPDKFSPDKEKAKSIIAFAKNDNRLTLTEIEAKQLMATYEIPVTKFELAKTREQAEKFAKKIGFPLAMKIVSHDIQHKTDVGGVQLNIKSIKEAGNTFDTIINSVKKANKNAEITGILLEKMVSKKYELLIGAKKDPIFGPLVVFGYGGITVEVFKDTNFGLPPLNMTLAQRIIENTKIYKLLKGYRGMPAVDIEEVKFILYKFAYLIMDFPEIKEVDINPFVIDHTGGVVLDAKVILDKEVLDNPVKPYSHLVIQPYPQEYVSNYLLKNGTEILLRPVKPEDVELEKELYYSLSKQTKYYRFISYMPEVSHEFFTRFTHIDYDREIAIVAEIMEEGKKKLIGVVRIAADAYNHTAEFAIVIADKWHGLGLGSKLFDYIIEIAKDREIKKIVATCLKDNDGMIRMFRKRNFSLKSYGPRTYLVELEL